MTAVGGGIFVCLAGENVNSPDSPRKILVELAYSRETMFGVRRTFGPGRVIEDLSREIRDQLKNLRSEDIAQGVRSLECYHADLPSRRRGSVFKFNLDK